MCSLYKLAYVKHVVCVGWGGQEVFLFVCNRQTVQSYYPFLYCNHLAQDFTLKNLIMLHVLSCLLHAVSRVGLWMGRLEMY